MGVITYNGAMARISVAPVRKIAKKQGIRFAAELARRADISYPTALNWWKDEPMETLDLRVMEKIADALGCEPIELIEGKI